MVLENAYTFKRNRFDLDEHPACRAAAVELADDTRTLHQLRDLSYSEQYDILFTGELDAKKVHSPSSRWLLLVLD